MLRSLRITNLVLIQEAELELSPGLNAITGETGAGKTILTNAIGLLLGAKGDAALIGAAGEEAYVEAELDGLDDDALGPLAELRPDGEEGVVLARRIFKDGRTRAYAWGRSAAREDVAAAAEAAIAMSGQFEQRRLARPAYQRSVLDAFAGIDLRPAAAVVARAPGRAARTRGVDERRGSGAAPPRRAAAPWPRTRKGSTPGREDELRADRERLRHVGELADGASRAAGALASDDGEGATDLVAAAERAVAPLERLAPELRSAGDALRSAELQLRETASELRSFLLTLEAEPGRLEEIESELDRFADLRRRYRAQTFAELVTRGVEARLELDALGDGHDPAAAAEQALAHAEAEVERVHAELSAARRGAAEPFAEAVAGELQSIGMGDGEFRVEVREREPGVTGADEVGIPDPAERRLAVRTGRRDGVRRRALAGRARDRRRGRRRDDGLRRDRRRHRRHDRARGRRDAAAARRAGSGRDDHASAADRDGRRAALPGREGAGRPDAHADRSRSTTSSAATSSSACSAARSSSPRSNADRAAGLRRLSDAAPSMGRVRGLRALVRSKPVSFITDRGGL